MATIPTIPSTESSARLVRHLSSDRMRIIAWFLAAIVVGISVIPVVGFVVGTGLDPSWGLAFHMARARHLAFGSDIVWPYGPLSFLLVPTMAYPMTGLAAYWLRLPVFAGTAGFVIRRFNDLGHSDHASQSVAARTRRCLVASLAVVAAVPVTWTLVGALGSSANLIIALYVFAASFAVRSFLTRRVPTGRSLVLGAVLSGLAVLTRFDTGVVGFGLVVLIALDAKMGFRRLGTLVCLFAGTIASGWVALGQPVSSFVPYVARSLELGRGYGGGLAWSSHPSWTNPVVLACVALTTLTIGFSRTMRRPSRWGLVGCVGLVLTTAQQSFSRYDTGHTARTVCFCTALLVVFATRRNIVLTVLSLLFCVLTTVSMNDAATPYPQFGWPPRNEVPFMHPTTGWRFAWRTFDFTVFASKREARIAREHNRLGSALGIPENVRAVIRGHSVHVEPWESSAAWVYGWRWRPLPIFASYQAYTPLLDRVNANLLRDDRKGPETVLTQSVAIDGRVPRWTSPDAMVALVCSYKPAASGGGWTAWTRRVASACAAATVHPSIGERELANDGLRRSVSALNGPEQIVIVRFEPKTSLLSRLRAGPLPLEVNGSRPQFLTAELAEGPHIVALPSCLRNDASLRADTDGGFDTSDILPTNLHGNFISAQIETIPYVC